MAQIVLLIFLSLFREKEKQAVKERVHASPVAYFPASGGVT